MDLWDYFLLYALLAMMLVRWVPRPTSAKSVERRIREYRRHHANPLRYRRTPYRRSPRLRDYVRRICGSVVFLAKPQLGDRTLRWAGDFHPGPKDGQ